MLTRIWLIILTRHYRASILTTQYRRFAKLSLNNPLPQTTPLDYRPITVKFLSIIPSFRRSPLHLYPLQNLRRQRPFCPIGRGIHHSHFTCPTIRHSCPTIRHPCLTNPRVLFSCPRPIPHRLITRRIQAHRSNHQPHQHQHPQQPPFPIPRQPSHHSPIIPPPATKNKALAH